MTFPSRSAFSIGALLLAFAPAEGRCGDLTQKWTIDPSPFTSFGSAIDVEGGEAVVGTYYLSGFDGFVYVLDTATGQVLERLERTDPDPDPTSSSWFGGAVSISSARILVGAPLDDEGGEDAGAAYLFDRVTRQPIAKLLAPVPAAGDRFGRAVAAGERYLAIGAQGGAIGSAPGSVSLFDAATGAFLRELAPQSAFPGGTFGVSVAVDGDLVAVGARPQLAAGLPFGAVYLFDAATGQELGRLRRPEPGGADSFGGSIALEGGTLAVGDTSAEGTPGIMRSGAVYLFDAGTQQLLSKLVADVTVNFAGVGRSVKLHGDRVATGAASGNLKAAFLFDRHTGLLLSSYEPPGGQTGTDFGTRVALDGERIYIADTQDSEAGPQAGAVYAYDIAVTSSTPYCFGDGSSEPCPCGNAGLFGRGCANGVEATGASLRPLEVASVSEDRLELRVVDSAPGQTGLFFQGTTAANGGAGLPMGDGLRCVGGTIRRLKATNANSFGNASSGPGLAGQAGLLPGDVAYYQWWYRDAGLSPCGGGFNFSNGLELRWGP